MKSSPKTLGNILSGALVLALLACEAAPSEIRKTAEEPEHTEVKAPEHQDGVLTETTQKQAEVAPPQAKKIRFVPPVVTDDPVDAPPVEKDLNIGAKSNDFGPVEFDKN